MNPANGAVAASASGSAVALAPPPQPPQPHRPSTSCDRHPDERFTGFCPCCLFERLSVLELSINDAAASSSSSSSRKPPLSAAALKAIFKPSSSGNAAAASGSSQPVRPGLFPELRRTKSFSATKNEGFSCAFEPQRRSCDVRARNTLWSLFNEDDERNPNKKAGRNVGDGAGSSGGGGGEIEDERRNSSVKSPVFEEKTEIEGEHEERDDYRDSVKEAGNVIEPVGEIVEEEEEKEVVEAREVEPKERMDSSAQPKKPNRDFKDIAGSFWSAASVFSKKVQKWRQKQKLKKHRNGRGGGSAALPVEKPIGRQFRDTQSEIADYGYGRRSCDTDPRFSIDAGRFSLDAGRISLDAGRISLDAGRVSVDDPRYSFDEPRASWDGYLIGRTTIPPRMPSMLSVVEDSPVRNHVLRSDTQIPVEEPLPPPPAMDENAPGGSAQTRDYYSDSSSRRRKSLDRSSSVRKAAASVVAEIDEQKTVSNARVSPFQDRDPKDSHSQLNSHSNSNSLRDDCSVENLEIGCHENAGNVDNKKGAKKSKRWSWNIFGLIQRKGGNKYEEEEDDDERFSSRGRNGVERSFSGSWNGERRKGFDPRMMRSNSSVSWRSSGSFTGGGGGFQRKSNADGYNNGKKRVDGNKIDNGMLRFYLAPMRGSRRGSNGRANPVPVHPMARNMMKLY